MTDIQFLGSINTFTICLCCFFCFVFFTRKLNKHRFMTQKPITAVLPTQSSKIHCMPRLFLTTLTCSFRWPAWNSHPRPGPLESSRSEWDGYEHLCILVSTNLTATLLWPAWHAVLIIPNMCISFDKPPHPHQKRSLSVGQSPSCLLSEPW